MANINNKHIKKGKDFELIIIDKNNVKHGFSSTFLEILNDGYIISAPKYKEEIYALEKDKYINIYLYVEDGIYKYKCKVQQTSADFYKISLPISSEHSQRREFLRVDMKLNAKVTIEYEHVTKEYNVISNNISAKGINFNLNEAVYDDWGKIEIEFNIEDRFIKTWADLAYCNKKNTLCGMVYNVALSFTSITQSDLDFIARACFLSQLKDRQENLKRISNIQYE